MESITSEFRSGIIPEHLRSREFLDRFLLRSVEEAYVFDSTLLESDHLIASNMILYCTRFRESS